MRTYEERKSRDTGISRLVALDNKNADERFKNTLNKRGFIQVRKYIRSAKSTASSKVSSEPSKTATFQPYFSKFCKGTGKGGIDRRVGRAIKKLGAGARNIRLVKQASKVSLEKKLEGHNILKSSLVASAGVASYLLPGIALGAGTAAVLAPEGKKVKAIGGYTAGAWAGTLPAVAAGAYMSRKYLKKPSVVGKDVAKHIEKTRRVVKAAHPAKKVLKGIGVQTKTLGKSPLVRKLLPLMIAGEAIGGAAGFSMATSNSKETKKQASAINYALTPVILNSLYAAYDARNKEEKSLYHKLSLLAGATATGITSARLVADLSSKIISAKRASKVLNKLVTRTTQDLISISPTKALTKRQILAKKLGSNKKFGEKYLATIGNKTRGIQEVKILNKIQTPLTVGGGVLGLGIGGASYGS